MNVGCLWLVLSFNVVIPSNLASSLFTVLQRSWALGLALLSVAGSRLIRIYNGAGFSGYTSCELCCLLLSRLRQLIRTLFV